MKKYFSLLAAVVVIATSFISCSKDSSPLEEEQDVKSVKVSFNAKVEDPSTKTYFGDKTDAGYPTRWSSNQLVKIAADFYGPNLIQDAVVSPSTDGKTASFDADFPGIEDYHYLYFSAVSPASAVVDTPSGHFKIAVPEKQTPTMGSVDEAAHILGAKSEERIDGAALPERITLSFSHLVAYGKFMLKDFPEDVTIKRIELSADDFITGEFVFIDESFYTGTLNKGKKLTIDVSKIEASNNASMVFWFSVLPVNLEGKTLTFTVVTNNGKYVKAITFPTGTGNFKVGKVATFSINMKNAVLEPMVYTLVTDYYQLTEGSEVILVSNARDYAMNTAGENYWGMTSITKSADKSTISNPGDDVQTFNLKKGISDNHLMFELSNGSYAGNLLGAKTTETSYIKTIAKHSPSSAAVTDGYTSFAVDLEWNKLSLDLISNNYKDLNNYYSPEDLANNIPEQNYVEFTTGVSSSGMIMMYKLEGSGEGGTQLIVATPQINFTEGVFVGEGYYDLGDGSRFPASGGTCTIRYEVNHPLAGGRMSCVTIDHGYITVNINSDNSITVTVKANTSGSPRTDRFVLLYDSSDPSITESKTYTIWVRQD